MRSLFVFFLLLLCVSSYVSSEKIHQRDIQSLLLENGRITTSRRVPGMHQLQCVSGCYLAKLERVMCINKGYDGNNVNWKCESTDLPDNVKFGRMTVSCEGYDYSGDKYVLPGSCGLEYSLSSTYQNSYHHEYDNSFLNFIGVFFLLIFICMLLSVFPVVYEYPYYSYRYYMWNDPFLYRPRYYNGPRWNNHGTSWHTGNSWLGSSSGGGGLKFGFASTTSR